MTSILERSNRIAALAATLVLVTLAACGDNGTDPEPEPEVATIRVSVGSFSVDVPNTNAACTNPTNTPVPLTVNQANQVSFRFLGADGQDEPIIAAERDHLELELENQTSFTLGAASGSGATFTRAVTPSATGSFIPRVVLFSEEHGHNEIECLMRVTVTQ